MNQNLKSCLLQLAVLVAGFFLENESSFLVADMDSMVICTPPQREVCGPVRPGPGPIICRCV